MTMMINQTIQIATTLTLEWLCGYDLENWRGSE